MTDEQFDEICRKALAYEPGMASGATWSRIRPTRRSWLPTVPEILACGCVCGLILLVVGARYQYDPRLGPDSNTVIQMALRGSSIGLQASAFQVPDMTPWTETSLSLPPAAGAFLREGN
jgi:hypothetical protein